MPYLELEGVSFDLTDREAGVSGATSVREIRERLARHFGAVASRRAKPRGSARAADDSARAEGRATDAEPSAT